MAPSVCLLCSFWVDLVSFDFPIADSMNCDGIVPKLQAVFSVVKPFLSGKQSLSNEPQKDARKVQSLAQVFLLSRCLL